jgi:cytochrome bd-type quinol oxidase subunit 2
MNESKQVDSAASKKTKNFVVIAVVVLLVVAFFGALFLQFRAEKVHDLGMEQLALIAEIAVVIMVVVGIAVLISPQKGPTENQTEPSESAKLAEQKKNHDAWLARLVVVTALGMCVIVLYTVQWLDDKAITIAGVALLSAGGAWLIAVVVGFLFGIPRLSSDQLDASQYHPSTSLEQVADWLTKIIVGVGLTQLYKIPGKLDSLATYIAAGMGEAPSHKVLALAICIYFPSCGFLFGFLWARLYMLEAFDVAGALVSRFMKGVAKQKKAETQGDS